jgi:hypothetical protein
VWLISSDCYELLDALPVAVADEERDGDIVKTDSVADDILDTARYGLKSIPTPKAQPKDERRKQQLASFDDDIRRIRALRDHRNSRPEKEAERT